MIHKTIWYLTADPEDDRWEPMYDISLGLCADMDEALESARNTENIVELKDGRFMDRTDQIACIIQQSRQQSFHLIKY